VTVVTSIATLVFTIGDTEQFTIESLLVVTLDSLLSSLDVWVVTLETVVITRDIFLVTGDTVDLTTKTLQ